MNHTRSSRALMIQRKLTARLASAAPSVVVSVCVVADIKFESLFRSASGVCAWTPARRRVHNSENYRRGATDFSTATRTRGSAGGARGTRVRSSGAYYGDGGF